MNSRILILTLGLLTAGCGLFGQAEESAEPVVPTEVAKPPYELGDLVVEQGYYIDREEGETRINFRFVENKLRIFWIDANGLIAEPEYDSAVVRFVGSVRGRSFHGLKMLPSKAGLGAPVSMYPPHLYSVIMVFSNGEGEEPTVYNFRYTPDMDVPVDPTVAPAE